MRISDWSSDVCSSDLVVIADATTPVEFAAIDVVLQAEHGPDGLAWLVTWDEAVADAVAEAADDRFDAERFGKPGHAGAQAADAAPDQPDQHPPRAALVQLVDDAGVAQAVLLVPDGDPQP